MENLTNKPDHNIANKTFADAEVWWILFYAGTQNLGQADRQADRHRYFLSCCATKNKIEHNVWILIKFEMLKNLFLPILTFSEMWKLHSKYHFCLKLSCTSWIIQEYVTVASLDNLCTSWEIRWASCNISIWCLSSLVIYNLDCALVTSKLE